VTLTIRYRGPAARAGALVTALEREGVSVDWTPPQEQRGVGADATAVALSLVASGAYDAIKAAVAKMREWMPRTEIIIENEPGGEDAEPPTPPERAIRPDVVQALYSALTDMDPARLASLAETGITPAERKQAEELHLAGMLASQDYRDRESKVWELLITRQWSSPPTWEQLFDELTPERAARLGELYDALPDGARVEYDNRYGRPQDL
jgi:hypothetical protein